MRARNVLPVLAVAALGFAGAASAHDHERTIHLVESPHLQLSVVDANATGASAGDQIAVRDVVRRLDGGPTAPLREQCMLIDAGKGIFDSTYECTGSIELPEGTILFGGPFTPNLPDQAQAVTGGTGVYRAAAGQADIRAEDDQIVVHLVR
jgi:hypothetical protein